MSECWYSWWCEAAIINSLAWAMAFHKRIACTVLLVVLIFWHKVFPLRCHQGAINYTCGQCYCVQRELTKNFEKIWIYKKNTCPEQSMSAINIPACLPRRVRLRKIILINNQLYHTLCDRSIALSHLKFSPEYWSCESVNASVLAFPTQSCKNPS